MRHWLAAWWTHVGQPWARFGFYALAVFAAVVFFVLAIGVIFGWDDGGLR